tara:strand:- start:378 stop:911 length:534 start_codon:yes stop_codon:yes gene_type:complete
MRKKTIFKTELHYQPFFLSQSEIDKLISSIKKDDLKDHGSLIGNAKSTYHGPEKQFLDNHLDVKDKINAHLLPENLEVVSSWINVQGENSKLNYHNHPNSVLSGAIFLKTDDVSSELYFKNPNSQFYHYGEDESVMPVTGLCLMWPSWLMHGSGNMENKSTERIVLSFNTFFKKGGV